MMKRKYSRAKILTQGQDQKSDRKGRFFDL